jgi:hypothetical protein
MVWEQWRVVDGRRRLPCGGIVLLSPLMLLDGNSGWCEGGEGWWMAGVGRHVVAGSIVALSLLVHGTGDWQQGSG